MPGTTDVDAHSIYGCFPCKRFAYMNYSHAMETAQNLAQFFINFQYLEYVIARSKACRQWAAELLKLNCK